MNNYTTSSRITKSRRRVHKNLKKHNPKHPNPSPPPTPPSSTHTATTMPRRIKNHRKPRWAKPKGEGSSSSLPPMVPASAPARVWEPGVDGIGEGEELQCDPSAYDSLYAFHVGWPCLSFDILRDSLGLVRTEFPHTVFAVSGSQIQLRNDSSSSSLLQAEKSSWNSIEILKLSNLTGRKQKLVPIKTSMEVSDEDGDSSDSDDDGDEMDQPGPRRPTLQASLPLDFLFGLVIPQYALMPLLRKVAHEGCVNRIRSMPQNPHICASWSDTGYVQVWDIISHLNFLAESQSDVTRGTPSAFNQAPLAVFKHKDEGYAIDWSPVVPGRLLSGDHCPPVRINSDCNKHIHLWEPSSGTTWEVDPVPFVGHTGSVEDLQWSPTEENVFASCSADGCIGIWDTRLGRSPAFYFKAHNADVNVISWNRLASCMLASGSDDGSFSIRDLRVIKVDNSPVAHFEYHKHPITSIEWSPHEGSAVAVTSSDNQLTIWDLSLERDEEEEAEFRAQMSENVNAPRDLPPQLLFIHQGQKDLKELHWHAQIPGMIMSTAADGFNILMPSNIANSLPPVGAQ
ncbi:HEAT STRESS TOLERANT DWD 1-like protein [Drosera capensis]